MKFKLQEIDDYYYDLYKTLNPIAMQKHYFLKHFYEKPIRKFADIKANGKKDYTTVFDHPDIRKIHDQNYFKTRGKFRREFKDLLKKNCSQEIINPSTIKIVNKYLLNESLACLDRSIYWFLSYHRNMDGFCLNPKLQNLYYSEFFIHLSISRYLGLAYTWISKINLPIKTQIQKVDNNSSKQYEENMKVNVSISPKIGGMHETVFLQIRYHIEQNIDLPHSTISEWFKPSYITSIFKDERETVVYDISRGQNDPWHPAHHNLARDYSTFCFLDGGDQYYKGDPEVDHYIYEKYGNWGYREAHIGDLIKWMIKRLKSIKANRFLKKLTENIKNLDGGLYPKSLKEPKSILLHWLAS